MNSTGQDSAGQVQVNKRKVRQQIRKYVGDQWKNSRRESLEIRHVFQPDSGGTSKSSDLTLGQHGASDSRRRSEASGESEEEASPTLTSSEVNSLVRMHTGIPAVRPSASNYDAARTRYDFDLTWLSGLTISGVGSMRSGDESIGAWLKHRENTFLDMVPVYYGHSKVLRRVVDAILAKAAYTMQPCSKTHKASLSTYGLALQEVQKGLLDAEVAKSTEMLCAIRVLQMYELLDATTVAAEMPDTRDLRSTSMSSDSDADAEVLEESADDWRVTATQTIGSHSQGMQSLVKMRSPSSFKTEMDKSLLCSLLEGFWLQAYLNNTDYFLETREWLSFIRTLATENDKVRHPIALDLWLTLSPLPRLLRQTDIYIDTHDIGVNRTTALLELHTLRTNLTTWVDNLEMERTNAALPFSEALYQELLGFGLGTLAIVCRSLVALAPNAAGAISLEAQAQRLAKRCCELVVGNIASSGFFVGVCTLATANEWDAAIVKARTDGDEMLDKEAWAKWSGMMGRKPHSERLGVPWKKEVDEAVRMFVEKQASPSTYTGLIWYL